MIRQLLLMALFAPFCTSPLYAQICAASVGTGDGIGDGCTLETPDFNFRNIPHIAAFEGTFTPSCNTHDKCYTTLGADYGACDSNFYSDMRQACKSKFNPLLRPAEYSLCMQTALEYYGAVSYYRDSIHPQLVVEFQRDALQRSVYMQYYVEVDSCGTTPEKTALYTTGLIAQVNNAFQAAAGRKPTIYEFFDGINAGTVWNSGAPINWNDPNARNYVSDRATWQGALASKAALAASRPPPSATYLVSSPEMFVHNFTVSPVSPGTRYDWFLNTGNRPNSTALTFSYSPPQETTLIQYRGFLKATNGAGVRNMSLVERTLVLQGSCSPIPGQWVPCY